MSNPLKKTMAYLGLVEEDLETEQQQRPVAPVAPAAQSRAAAVTPLRKQTAAPTQQAEMNEILTVHPRQYRDAQVIAEAFRDGVPVIINLSQMADGDAKRLIDFASGLSQGLYGRIERVTNKVFLLSPAHVAISGEAGDAEGDVDASFFSRG